MDVVASSLNLADRWTKGLKCDLHEILNSVIFGCKSPS